MVIDKFAAAAPVYFEIPEELRPGRAPFQPAPASAPAVTATLAPAAAFPTLAADPAPAAMPTTRTSLPPASTSGASGVPAPLTPPASDLGTGLGDAAALPAGLGGPAGLDGLGGLGGLGGLANRIVDEMSGLLGSAGEQLNDPSGLDDALRHRRPRRPRRRADDKADDDDESDAEPEKPEEIQTAQAEEAKPGDSPPAGGPPPINTPPPAAVPPVDAQPPAAAPPPVAAPPASGKTPCEIAADELPKAGQ